MDEHRRLQRKAYKWMSNGLGGQTDGLLNKTRSAATPIGAFVHLEAPDASSIAKRDSLAESQRTEERVHVHKSCAFLFTFLWAAAFIKYISLIII